MDNLVTSKEVAQALRICYDHFRKEVKHQPDFPKPILLTPKAHPRWRLADIKSYLDNKSS